MAAFDDQKGPCIQAHLVGVHKAVPEIVFQLFDGDAPHGSNDRVQFIEPLGKRIFKGEIDIKLWSGKSCRDLSGAPADPVVKQTYIF